MKFRIQRDTLLESLSIACRIVPVKSLFVQYDTITIDVTEMEIVLTTNSSDCSIKTTIPVTSSTTVEVTGNVAVDAKTLLQSIRMVDSQFVTIAFFNERELRIEGGSSKFKIYYIDNKSFISPVFDFNEKNSFQFPTKVLKNVIREVNLCAADDDSRALLNGVNIKSVKNKVVLTASDSFRLTQREIELANIEEDFNITVPKKALDDIYKIIDDSLESIICYINGGKLIVSIGNVLFQTRLIEGNYPSAERVIPKTFVLEVTVNREEFIRSLEVASSLSSGQQDNNIHAVLLHKTLDGEFELTSLGGHKGASSFTLKLLQSSSSDSFELYVNAKNFIDCLKIMDCVNVEVLFSGKAQAMIVRAPIGNNQFYLLMPINFN
jgi:DNA polymerase-3 subunit beta